MKKEIINCLIWYATNIATTTQYTEWSDEYCRKVVKESTEKMLEELKKYIDWDYLTKEEARELGFKPWDLEEIKEKVKGELNYLYLIPLYLVPTIPIGTKLISIFGDEIVYAEKNIDIDIRFGCIAYGINVKD